MAVSGKHEVFVVAQGMRQPIFSLSISAAWCALLCREPYTALPDSLLSAAPQPGLGYAHSSSLCMPVCKDGNKKIP